MEHLLKQSTASFPPYSFFYFSVSEKSDSLKNRALLQYPRYRAIIVLFLCGCSFLSTVIYVALGCPFTSISIVGIESCHDCYSDFLSLWSYSLHSKNGCPHFNPAFSNIGSIDGLQGGQWLGHNFFIFMFVFLGKEVHSFHDSFQGGQEPPKLMNYYCICFS